MCAAHVLSSVADVRRVCVFKTQLWLVFELVVATCYGPRRMQKERPQFIQVWPRATIEHAPSPTAQPTRTLSEAS